MPDNLCSDDSLLNKVREDPLGEDQEGGLIDREQSLSKVNTIKTSL